jgi:opacity protein-like surface antigen
MSRLLISLLAGLGLAATALAPASAQNIPSGSYQQSCTNIRVRGDQLFARCTNPQGTYVRSTITLSSCRNGDIVNSNGQLACNNNGNGNGYGYGRRHRRDGDNNGGYNNGNNGGYNNGNNGGYNGGYNNGRYGNGTVSGSYQSSCTNVYMNGPTLTASCTAPNGQRITSSINPAQCRGGDIANVNGRLACR